MNEKSTRKFWWPVNWEWPCMEEIDTIKRLLGRNVDTAVRVLDEPDVGNFHRWEMLDNTSAHRQEILFSQLVKDGDLPIDWLCSDCEELFGTRPTEKDYLGKVLGRLSSKDTCRIGSNKTGDGIFKLSGYGPFDLQRSLINVVADAWQGPKYIFRKVEEEIPHGFGSLPKNETSTLTITKPAPSFGDSVPTFPHFMEKGFTVSNEEETQEKPKKKKTPRELLEELNKSFNDFTNALSNWCQLPPPKDGGLKKH